MNKTIACITKQVFFNSYFERLNLTLHSESCKQLASVSSSAWWFLVQIFHKVVQQHVSGVMRSLVITSLQIYWWVCQWKNSEMWLRSDRVTVTSLVSSFFRTYCIRCCHQFVAYSCYDSTLHLLDKCRLIIKWPLTERPTQQTASLPVLRYHLHPPTPLMSNVGRTLQYTKGQVFKDSKTQHTATVSMHNQYQLSTRCYCWIPQTQLAQGDLLLILPRSAPAYHGHEIFHVHVPAACFKFSDLTIL